MYNTIQMYIIITLMIYTFLFKLLFLIMFMCTNLKCKLLIRDLALIPKRYGTILFIIGLKLDLIYDILFYKIIIHSNLLSVIIETVSTTCLILGAAFLLKKYFIMRKINFTYNNPFILW